MADKELTTTEATEEEKEFTFVEDPTFDIDYKGDCAYEVKVSVPAANATKQSEEMFDQLQEEVEVPGFRRGRAPKKLVERKFAKAVKSDVERKLVGEAFQKLMDDEKLNPIALPDVDGLEDSVERKDGEPLTFTLKFEVSPRVQLGTYCGLELERPVVEITDKDVKKAIDELKQRHAVYEDLEDGTAAEGDQVIMDFEGTIDGEPFAGGAAQNYPYILGSKRFFPEFETALNGSSVGEELTCEITFPDDYHGTDVRGKTAQFTIKVNGIKRRSLPKLSDEFAKQAGYESKDDMKAKIQEQLEEHAKTQSDRVVEANALKAIVEGSTFELPKSVITRLTNDYVREEMNRLQAMRVPASKVEEQMDEITKNAQERAVNTVKSSAVLNEIADAEGLEVTDEDFEKEAEKMADRYSASIELVQKFMSQDDQRSGYENRILQGKIMALIVESAKVTDKKVSRKELDKEEQEADETTEE